ncbi:hypothetical protein GCM10027037_22100 [Mucilaginibacter koreensis]
MDLPVQNITDLQSEILRLEKLRQQQKIDLRKRFSSPSAIFATAKTLFPRSQEDSHSNHLFGQDILGLLSRVVLPFTLNKTLFKNSNFIVKSLVGLISQKASTYVNEGAVTGAWGKVKNLFSKLPKKPKAAVVTAPPTGVPAEVDAALPMPVAAVPVQQESTITEGYPEPPKNY